MRKNWVTRLFRRPRVGLYAATANTSSFADIALLVLRHSPDVLSYSAISPCRNRYTPTECPKLAHHSDHGNHAAGIRPIAKHGSACLVADGVVGFDVPTGPRPIEHLVDVARIELASRTLSPANLRLTPLQQWEIEHDGASVAFWTFSHGWLRSCCMEENWDTGEDLSRGGFQATILARWRGRTPKHVCRYSESISRNMNQKSCRLHPRLLLRLPGCRSIYPDATRGERHPRTTPETHATAF